ncbi:phosphatidylinositol 4-5-bisphosphate 3-kinase catalytic subunit alpha isoform [Brachionus plicatilis]|uniref:Phosphatidylinositol 4-5-bisphosphate 3-kinase catalytic subunit alpha isoform n=1 Tax=Brachionus plicatilis TaxID=10195 RepID=A0A3M7QMQ2_BRAPC|nr:phosphatidylinositol 4-5-bisphosphate 3-kinase catalytic subunit alpha isoform [Brachionus plicatilis]
MLHCSNEYQYDEVEIDFLFPNGFSFTSRFPRNCSIRGLKNLLKTHLKELKYDSYFKLSESYFFSAVTTDAQKIELLNDSLKLSDLNLMFWTFNVKENLKDDLKKMDDSSIEPQWSIRSFEVDEHHEDNQEKINDTEIERMKYKKYKYRTRGGQSQRGTRGGQSQRGTRGGQSQRGTREYAVGFSFEELNESRDIELIEYRIEMLTYVRDLIVNELNMNPSMLQSEIISSSFGLNLEINIDHLVYSIDKNFSKGGHKVFFDIAIHDVVTPRNMDGSFIVVKACINQKPSEVIKEYFKIKLNGIVDNEKISKVLKDYEKSYVLNVCGSNEIIYGNSQSLVLKSLPEEQIRFENNFAKEKVALSILDSSFFFQVKIDFAALIRNHLDILDKIFFKTSIFANGNQISKVFESDKYDLTLINEELKLPLNLKIHFGVKIQSLPRCSKFCFGLFSISKKKKTISAFAFLSINLFDYKDFLINGRQKLPVWSLESTDSYENLCLNHFTGPNPDKNSSYIRVHFLHQEKYKFPTIDQIQSYCLDSQKHRSLEDLTNNFQTIINKNCLNEMSSLEKKVVWQNRSKCSEYPHSLLKLVKCINWTDHCMVLEYYKLLEDWPFLKPIDALMLLNSDVADKKTRSFAVQCLDVNMQYEEVEFFILQIVQMHTHSGILREKVGLLKRGFDQLILIIE